MREDIKIKLEVLPKLPRDRSDNIHDLERLSMHILSQSSMLTKFVRNNHPGSVVFNTGLFEENDISIASVSCPELSSMMWDYEYRTVGCVFLRGDDSSENHRRSTSPVTNPQLEIRRIRWALKTLVENMYDNVVEIEDVGETLEDGSVIICM